MIDFNLLACHLLEIADDLAKKLANARVMVFMDGLPDEPVISSNMILITRDNADSEKTRKMADNAQAIYLNIPAVYLDRTGQVNLVILLAISQKLLVKDDAVIFLVGEQGKLIDTMHIMTIGDQLNLVDIFDDDDQDADPKHVRRAVFQRALGIALNLAEEGREGKPIGAFFVIGDAEKVLEHVEQLIINPFMGYPEDMRNLLDTKLLETVKEFSSIDGAFVIRGDGVILSAGTLIRASLVDEDLPKGLGARHAAAAGITRVTEAMAITISESDATVRVWRKGRIVTAFEHA